jgi:hypothetical protein
MATKRFCISALLLLSVACAHRGAQSPETDEPEEVTRHNEDVIASFELTDPFVAPGTVMEAVRRLRPRFLVDPDSASGRHPVHVSLNGGQLLPVDRLINVRVRDVVEIRYVNPEDAVLTWGSTTEGGGVILLRTK